MGREAMRVRFGERIRSSCTGEGVSVRASVGRRRDDGRSSPSEAVWNRSDVERSRRAPWCNHPADSETSQALCESPTARPGLRLPGLPLMPANRTAHRASLASGYIPVLSNPDTLTTDTTTTTTTDSDTSERCGGVHLVSGPTSASCSCVVPSSPCAMPAVIKHSVNIDNRSPRGQHSSSVCRCDACTSDQCLAMTTAFHNDAIQHNCCCASSSQHQYNAQNSVLLWSVSGQHDIDTTVTRSDDDGNTSNDLLAMPDSQILKPSSSSWRSLRLLPSPSTSIFVSLLLVALCGTCAVASPAATIPGCADIDNLENTFNFETSSLNDLLLCFCKVKNDSNVAISCLYGSSLDDLGKAMSLVAAANATVDEIALSHVEFNETGLPDDFFKPHAAHLRSLSIGLCAQAGALQVQPNALRGLEETLQEVALTDCNIESMPEALSSLSHLRALSMARNKITHVEKQQMAVHRNLESLNLAGNFLNSMDEGTLAQLSDSLKTLILGEHNFINESITNEIAQLHNLKVLDLSKADGISELPEGMFERLDKLEKLLLMGCSLTAITDQSLRGLESLEELDLRINLIREVDCAAFKWLPNIRRLSLAGNYLNSSDGCVWQQLPSIRDLDLSWNELSHLPSDSFAQIGATLEVLNLRHNTNLSQIDENAFRNLTHLRRLNLSDTAVAQIDDTIFVPLTSLEALDLSNSQVESMERNCLRAQSTGLRELNIADNQLRSLPAQLLGSLNALQRLDLSSNPWLCDESIKYVVDEINAHYLRAAQISDEFALENANRTTCDRPYSLHGEVITDVDSKLLVVYDAAADTTTPKPTTTQTTANDTDDQQFTAQPFTFLPNEGVVGDEHKGGADHSQTATRAPPEYDINARQTLNDGTDNKLVATLIAIGVMLLVSVAVTFAVVMYIKKRKSENTDAVGDTELNMRPTYEVKKPHGAHHDEK